MKYAAVTKLFLLTAVFFFSRGALSAQEYLVRNWQTENGLPDNTVTAIQQTTNGFLWIGTFNGLARFDGVQFKVFDSVNTPELHSSRILSLLADGQGSLWIATEGGGLVRLTAGRFTEVPLGTNGQSESVASLFAGHDGAVWAAVAGKGVARLQAGRVDIFDLTNGTPAHRLAALSGDVAVQDWLTARDNLLTFRAGSWFSRPSQVPPGSAEIIAVQRSRNGRVWLAYPRRIAELAEPDGVTNRTTYSWNSKFSSALVTTLAEDGHGTLWVGTVNNGLYHSTPTGGFSPAVVEGLLSQNVISTIFEDQDGLIWAGTYRGGLFRIKRRTVTTLTPPDAGEVNVQTVCAARDGAVWLGTGGAGLYRYEQGKFTHYTETNGLANQHVCSVFEDSHTNLWVGTWGGLFRREGDHFRSATGTNVIPDRVLALYEDHAGDLWVGTYGGLARKHGDQWTLFTIADGLSSPDVRVLAEDPEGSLWVGTAGGGLDRFRNEQFTHFGAEAGFPQKMVVALDAESDGTLWIGTIGGGLVRFKAGRFTSYTTQDGLADNIIGGIIDDGLGCLWLSSQNGILRVSKLALNQYERGHSPPLPCLSLSVGDGLATPMCSGSGQPVAARTADGHLWIPNMKAVAIIEPGLIQPRTRMPNVVIEGVTIDGREHLPPSGGTLSVPFGRSRFEFYYTVLGLPSPEAARFRYQLDGFDQDWVNAGVHRAAYYGQLAPGRYQFRVMASGSEGVWHEATIPLKFDVVPHLWELRWFQILASTALVALLGGATFLNERRRLKRKLERAELQQALEGERGRIARDLHDDIGARLTEIVLMGEVAKRGEQTPQAIQKQLSGITTNVRGLVTAMEEVVWTVNPKNDSLPSLAAFLCDSTERFLAATGLSCRLEVDASLPPVFLTAPVRHHLFMAVKEALNNAAKHAAATKVWLRIAFDGTVLRVSITDDGHGFNPQNPAHLGNGLLNMRTRLESIQGQVEMRSEPGAGTTISFMLPIAGNVHRR